MKEYTGGYLPRNPHNLRKIELCIDAIHRIVSLPRYGFIRPRKKLTSKERRRENHWFKQLDKLNRKEYGYIPC